MRKNGTSKVFLDDIEKETMSNLTASIAPKADSNGITAEPIRDMFGNDLSESSSFGNSEESGIPPKELKLDFGEDENYTPKGENYLLQPEENYDKMYVTNYSNEANSGRIDTPGRESLFLFGDNVLLRPWKRLLGGTLGISKDYGNNVAQAIDEDRLKPKEEEGVIPEFHYTMGADDIYRALEDWHHEQMNNK